MNRSIVKVIGWTLTRSPVFFILAYVVVVFGFAGLYSAISSQFYHPYVRFENVMYDQVSGLRGALTAAFREALRAHQNFGDSNSFVIDHCEVGQINPGTSDQRITVELWITIKHKADQPQSFNIPVEVYTASSINSPGIVTCTANVEFYGDNADAWAAPFGGAEQIKGAVHTALPYVHIAENDLAIMRNVNAGYRGFPSAVPGVFGRMLYFSIVTITTVGFGDIVPMTGLARFFTGCEAVIGIVLLSLSVNSIWAWREQFLNPKSTGPSAPVASDSEIAAADPA